ncbi:MAG: glutamate-5-semialdehyde dehydrogenase [Candidatus Anammoxibacter sp.]
MDIKDYMQRLLKDARDSSRNMALAGTLLKNRALEKIADGLESAKAVIVSENEKDTVAAKENGLSSSVIDRLALTESRVKDMADGVREIIALKDPVGEVLDGYVRPNGLRIEKVRVPLGVVGIIYESRPNVTADAASLCLKTGNSVILRGGKESINSNIAIYKVITSAVEAAGLDKRCVQVVETADRLAVELLLKADEYVDVIIPRGGEALIRRVADESRIPVIKHYKGVCHTFVDEFADLNMAGEICINAKVQRPATCNAMETMLVHDKIARKFLPAIIKGMQEAGVEIRGCEKTCNIIKNIKSATEDDWSEEYLDLILSVKVVSSLDEAMDHICRYGSAHSDAIVTGSYANAAKFTNEVDSAATYVNASTRFTDGREFGMGAEIGISTDKLHARGPMGLPELTSYKYIVRGNGQIRK